MLLFIRLLNKQNVSFSKIQYKIFFILNAKLYAHNIILKEFYITVNNENKGMIFLQNKNIIQMNKI